MTHEQRAEQIVSARKWPKPGPEDQPIEHIKA